MGKRPIRQSNGLYVVQFSKKASVISIGLGFSHVRYTNRHFYLPNQGSIWDISAATSSVACQIMSFKNIGCPWLSNHPNKSCLINHENLGYPMVAYFSICFRLKSVSSTLVEPRAFLDPWLRMQASRLSQKTSLLLDGSDMGFTTCFFSKKKHHRKQHRTSTRNKNVWFLMVAPKNGSLWSKDIQGAPNLGSPASSFGSVCPSDKRVGLEDGPINGGWLMGFPDRNVSILLGIWWFFLLGGFQKWEKTHNNLKFPGNPGQNPIFFWGFHGFFQIVPVDFWNKPVMGCS